eukprot:m.67680 g.67680  ORF g.67680 m.67680 type:complete len:64 (+) comp14078_c0_seq1:1569-1760(+)
MGMSIRYMSAMASTKPWALQIQLLQYSVEMVAKQTQLVRKTQPIGEACGKSTVLSVATRPVTE